MEETGTMLRAKDIMKSDVPTTFENSLLSEAYYFMVKYHTRHLPVLNNHHELTGILSRGDILLHSSCDNEGTSVHAAPLQVKEIMTHQVISCRSETTLADVAATMIACKIDCIPVLEKGALVGMIQTTDFLNLFHQGQLECAS
jgi:CBS domain-containing protein